MNGHQYWKSHVPHISDEYSLDFVKGFDAALQYMKDNPGTPISSNYICDYCMHDCKDIRGGKMGCLSRFSGKKLSAVIEVIHSAFVCSYCSNTCKEINQKCHRFNGKNLVQEDIKNEKAE